MTRKTRLVRALLADARAEARWISRILALPVLLCTLSAAPVGAAPGDLIQNVPLAVPGFGVSVGVDCGGVVYYTAGTNNNLYSMDKDGNGLGSVPIVDSGSGAALRMDEMAWDQGREMLWAQRHNSNPIDVYLVDPTTGIATFQFTSATNSLGTFRDGIAYDGSDDSLWISGDVSDKIEHYQSDGTFINRITPKNGGGGILGEISGVMVGVGDLLYLGRDGFRQIVQVKKSNGDFIGIFTSPGGSRDEGLECDPINFPTLALWSRDTNNFMSVIEVEEGTCTCGGALPVPLDIHPTSCRNPINPKSKGKVPVAINGTADFDVTEIDPSTILLEGVAPLKSSVDDVSTPYEPYLGKEDPFDCTTEGPDGYDDLVLHFSNEDLIAAIGPLSPGEVLVLQLTAETYDGQPVLGEDVVVVVGGPACGLGFEVALLVLPIASLVRTRRRRRQA